MDAYSPLKQIKVLDLTVLLPGPYCTMLLAAMGAKVLKIENPKSGDLMRVMAPGTFSYLNAQKELLSLDLKSEPGREIFFALARECDVVVEGFRPGVAARLGVDFDSVTQANPSIIYCALSGYGQQGPYAELPAHDINHMGVAGLLAISGDPASGKPEYPYGPQYSDMIGALFGANAILASLLGRGPDAEAHFLDISLTESAGMLVMPRYLDFLQRGGPPKEEFMRRGPYEVFETRDHKFLTLGIVEDHFWVNFCNAAGLSELAHDPELQGWNARNRQAQRLKPVLEQAFKQRDREQWLEILRDADVPVAPVHGLDQWAEDPQLLARGFFRPGAQGVNSPAAMPHLPLPGQAGAAEAAEPDMPLGRDTEKWLQAQGLDSREIASLREQKVI
ncbi:MAG: CoA transferase [Deltaproteobacteria bacterium]|nr:CoA transferase [Deltaproteobacteria bacterium]